MTAGTRKIGTEWKVLEEPKTLEGHEVHAFLTLRFPVRRVLTEDQRARMAQEAANSALHAIYSMEQDLPDGR